MTRNDAIYTSHIKSGLPEVIARDHTSSNHGYRRRLFRCTHCGITCGCGYSFQARLPVRHCLAYRSHAAASIARTSRRGAQCVPLPVRNPGDQTGSLNYPQIHYDLYSTRLYTSAREVYHLVVYNPNVSYCECIGKSAPQRTFTHQKAPYTRFATSALLTDGEELV